MVICIFTLWIQNTKQTNKRKLALQLSHWSITVHNMDKYEQITKLAEAHRLIQEVINGREEYDDVSAELQDVANTVADIADEIEGVEQE